MSSTFTRDEQFSKHKDILLKDYWRSLSFEGRFIFTNSMMLQKTLGIDVILQVGSDNKEITIDTKHVKGDYKQLFIEEMSCSIKGREREGWGIKKEGTPDYIMHVLHPICNGCQGDCNTCTYTIEHISGAYITKTSKLQEWYLPKLKKGELNKYKLQKTNQINQTTGRNIPIRIMMKEMGTIACRLSERVSA